MKLICLMSVSNNRAKIRLGEYLFQWDEKMNPIPTEVKDSDAEIMLSLKSQPCSCRSYRTKPEALFERVK